MVALISVSNRDPSKTYIYRLFQAIKTRSIQICKHSNFREKMNSGAQAVAALSFMAFLLMVPTFVWHCVSKNIPAIFLIFWLAYSNLITFINILIWGQEDTGKYWDGKGYCDLTVKLKEGGTPGKIAAAAALAMNLYFILRAKPLPLLRQNSKRKLAIELSMCLITPIFVMCVSWPVQQLRYVISHYAGCQPSFKPTVGSIFLLSIWPFLWAVVAMVFTLLALAKFLQQRKELSNILRCTDSGLNIKRFARLLLFVIVVIVALAPLTCYQFARNVRSVTQSKETIGVDLRHKIFYSDLRLSDMYQQYIDVGISVLAFVVFGTGSEAIAMYKRFARKIFPSSIARYDSRARESSKTMQYPSRIESNAETAYSHETSFNTSKAYANYEPDELKFPPDESLYHSKKYIVKEGI